ncbi:Methyltransferase domain containing protein [uncultured Caudovirales phage]|uniref:Methyltransferase domain containing protein n=1 Tax=uncultured Caudovirales phage TaxID=2100421 RepID=A0A6J5L5G3_9CAUD|nr:Methyltransferase domain containing protein [uncultured Caudovirales phage]
MEHFYQNIQGWFIYNEIYDIAVQTAQEGAHFVEVGSWRGCSTAYMAVNIVNSGKKIQFDAVDTWRGSLDEEVHQKDPSVINDTLYDEFLANMAPVKDVVNPVRMTSMEAVKLYEDNSLDFVLIDGSHAYEDVRDDITRWMDKLKPGAMIAGDDYEWPGVKQAVNELLPGFTHFPQIGCWAYFKP